MSLWVLNLLCLLRIPTVASSKNVESSDRYDLDDIRFWNSIGRRNIEKKLQLNPHLLKSGLRRIKVTSSLDRHVTDSAASAMALFTGRKGVVRNAEYDEAEVHCARDIAKQLLSYPASEFKVLMGGGRRCLMNKSRNGSRGDGRNIDLEWLRLGGSRKVLRTPSDLNQIDAANVDKLLGKNSIPFKIKTERAADVFTYARPFKKKATGIFSDSHFPYYLEERLRNKKTVPRLHEMTKKAIEVLQKDDQGFFLMVEGGLIDQAQHGNSMHVTFSEMYEFEKAIRVAREMTNPNETLIIVTADHGHAFTLPGYLHAKQSLFEEISVTKGNYLESSRVVHRGGNTVDRVENWLPTLFFAVGPGYRNGFKEHPSSSEIGRPFYRHPTPVPARTGYHGGEDVGIWADGPFSEQVFLVLFGLISIRIFWKAIYIGLAPDQN
ncbi:unnamed protein product [Haemonchus placei]|uniref:alkaline phosphatase n=1 Tax=Haemonchus placei TaxID=6290 RepID=A0A0N4X245_HAEPC|nr:unnamed protein product [Haemonchus placei]